MQRAVRVGQVWALVLCVTRASAAKSTWRVRQEGPLLAWPPAPAAQPAPALASAPTPTPVQAVFARPAIFAPLAARLLDAGRALLGPAAPAPAQVPLGPQAEAAAMILAHPAASFLDSVSASPAPSIAPQAAPAPLPPAPAFSTGPSTPAIVVEQAQSTYPPEPIMSATIPPEQMVPAEEGLVPMPVLPPVMPMPPVPQDPIEPAQQAMPASPATPVAPLVPNGLTLPMPGSATVPETGELVQRARSLLGDTRRSLVNVSQELLSVQGSINEAEKSLVGRVLDAQSIQGLAREHDQWVAANIRAADALKQLNRQADELSRQLRESESEFVREAETQRWEERRLQEELDHASAVLQVLSARLVGQPEETEKVAFSLLQNESEAAVEADEAAVPELVEVREALREALLQEERMRKALVEQHVYGVTCHERAQELLKEMQAKSAPLESPAELEAQRKLQDSRRAGIQRLEAEGAILRSEVQQAEADLHETLTKLANNQHEYHELETSIAQDVQNLTMRVHEAKERQRSAKSRVDSTQDSSGEDMAVLQGLAERIRTLRPRISPVVAEAMRSENSALQIELVEIVETLKKSKADEVHAAADLQEMRAAVAAAEKSAESAAKTADKARADGQKALAKAVKESIKQQKEALIQINKAEAAITDKCNLDWEVRSKKKQDALEKCHQQEEDLSIAKAQAETLKQTLVETQAVQAAS